MKDNSIECAVIGASVIGLTVTRPMAMVEKQVLIIEQAGHICSKPSSCNSEVDHVGIYYPAGSLKTKHCVATHRVLYQYSHAMHVPYWRCGKLIDATNETQMTRIEELYQKGVANGVENLDYEVDARRSGEFYAELRKYFPVLKDGTLTVDYSGIRPKIVVDDNVLNDFMRSGPLDLGLDDVVKLFGIESLGLTAAISIADDIRQRLCT